MPVREVREALKKQIKDHYPNLSGKTIDKTLEVGRQLVLVFTDSSFVIYEASAGYDNDIDLNVTNDVPSYYTLRELGLITPEAALKQQKADLRSMEAYQKNWAKRQIQNALKQNKELLLEVLEEEGIITTNK